MSAIQDLVRWFLPNESRFFDYVSAVADTAHLAAKLFHELAHTDGVDARIAMLDDLRAAERAGDTALRTMSEALDATFVTPIDREDLYHLAAALEVISDFITSTANHLTVHRMETLPDGTSELSVILVEATGRCVEACRLLRQGNQTEAIRGACRDLDRLEHDADVLFRTRLGALFANEKDAITLIKHKEFLEGLEDSVDRCADVGTVLEAILIKNA
ncbi:MAG: DUF47 family protein [Myxococcota bacterium]